MFQYFLLNGKRRNSLTSILKHSHFTRESSYFFLDNFVNLDHFTSDIILWYTRVAVVQWLKNSFFFKLFPRKSPRHGFNLQHFAPAAAEHYSILPAETPSSPSRCWSFIWDFERNNWRLCWMLLVADSEEPPVWFHSLVMWWALVSLEDKTRSSPTMFWPSDNLDSASLSHPPAPPNTAPPTGFHGRMIGVRSRSDKD